MPIDLQGWGTLAGLITGGISLIAWIVKWIYIPINRPKLKTNFDKQTDLIIWDTYFNNTANPKRRKFFNLLIEKGGKNTATRCEANVSISACPASVSHLTGRFSAHWGDTPYSGRTTGTYPVDIGSSPHRLDVIFADKENPVGCWLAVPFALLDPAKAQQFHLPPGQYEIKISISCENGDGITKRFKVTSPQDWLDLDVNEL